MKKILAIMLTVALVMSLGAVTALAADPPYNGNVAGVITTEGANFSGTLTGDYNLTLQGQFTSGFVDHKAPFNATISGDISGTIVGGEYNDHGLDTFYGVITGTGAAETVRIEGRLLPQSGIDNDFAIKIITGPEPAPVTSLTIQSDKTTLAAGSSMQMTAVSDPAGYEILWAVYVNHAENARIDQDGVLHGLKTGPVTVIANTLDPTLATTTKTITIVDPETEVQASIDPTYTIVIPAAVNLGTLQKGVAVTPQTFNVSAQDVLIEAGKSIIVSVTSDFLLRSGSAELAYQLLSGSNVMASGGTFATFTGVATQNGSVQVPSTSGITTAGIYQDTMVFSISYE